MRALLPGAACAPLVFTLPISQNPVQGRGDDEVDEPKQIEKIKSDRTEVIEICDSSWLIANRADQDLVRNSRGISEEIWIPTHRPKAENDDRD